MGLYISNKWSLQLIDTIANLLIAGLERSAKFSHRSLTCDRFIIGPKQESFSSEQLHQILTGLNFPEEHIPDALNWFGKSNQTGIGFERNNSISSYRLYFEFFDRYRPEPVLNTGLIHLGYKWQCDNSANMKITRYSYASYFNGYNSEQIVRNVLITSNKEFCNTVVSAVKRTQEGTDPKLRIMTCASEEVGCRRSFDVNIYKSQKKVNFIQDELEKIARYFKIDQPVMEKFLQDSNEADLGHISCGTDTLNNPFFTVYFDDYTDFVKSNMKNS